MHMSTMAVHGDAPNRIALTGIPVALGLRRSAFCGRNCRGFLNRSIDAFSFRCLQGGGRRHGAGVRTLFRNANLLLSRRVFHRSQSLRHRAPWILALPRAVQRQPRAYKVFGYRGKQVRDNIHSLDVVRFIDEFIATPRTAEVYNLGGGRENSISILEAFDAVSDISGKPMKYEYVEATPRRRPYLLHLESFQNETALSEVVNQHGFEVDFDGIHDAWVAKLAAIQN